MGAGEAGIAIGVSDLTADKAVVHIYWKPSKGGVGKKLLPTKLEIDKVVGGKLDQPWPFANKLRSETDAEVIFTRDSKKDFILTIRLSDTNGGLESKILHIPPDPQFVKSCVRSLVPGFSGIPAGDTWQVGCNNLTPGSHVRIGLDGNAAFKVDAKNAWSISLGAFYSDPTSATGETWDAGGSILKVSPWHPDDTPKSWNMQKITRVPWDGRVVMKIYVGDAYVAPGTQSTLSAVSGNFVVCDLGAPNCP